jgi:hypothetical protein
VRTGSPGQRKSTQQQKSQDELVQPGHSGIPASLLAQLENACLLVINRPTPRKSLMLLYRDNNVLYHTIIFCTILFYTS